MQKFGGVWTEIKLDVIEGYLNFYTTVLADKPRPTNPFKLWYIDAFAGSGTRTVEVSGGSIFDEPAGEVELAGSARRALRIPKPFDRYVFIEGDRARFDALSTLESEFPDHRIECLAGDANEQLCRIFKSPPWSRQVGGAGSHRAVVFLDPYGMSVKWSTLEVLAHNGSVDVWYLFPVEGVNRQMSGKLDRVEPYKRLKLEEFFGTADWEKEFYQPTYQTNLFGDLSDDSNKVGSKYEIEEFAARRFAQIFRYVSKPIRLEGKGRGLIFSLFCLSNSQSHAAIALIKKGVTWLHDHYGYAMASRRKFDL